MAAAASASMAATAVLLHGVPAAKPTTLFCPLAQRPTLSSSHLKLLKESRRCSQVVVNATSSEESSLDSSELLNDLKEKWDAVENKTTVIIYGGGALVAVWVASIVVGAVNSVPLLPKIMELVGLGYTGWFVYRYLLFKSGRKELASDIEEVKKKIAGAD